MRFWNCFDTPSHTPYDFVLREENQIRIVDITIPYTTMKVYVLSLNFTDNPHVYVLCNQNLQKLTPKILIWGGGNARDAGLGSAFLFWANWSNVLV